MNLAEFLSRMQIPPYEELYNGTAKGVIKIGHPEVEIRTEENLESRTDSDCISEYIAFLGVVRDNPDLTFGKLYEIAMDQYGFPDHAPVADYHLGVLEFFAGIGVVRVDGRVGSRNMGAFYVFGIPERAGDSTFRLCDEGLKSVQVLSAIPKDPNNEQAFRRYFQTE